jgi:hypothetical protein
VENSVENKIPPNEQRRIKIRCPTTISNAGGISKTLPPQRAGKISQEASWIQQKNEEILTKKAVRFYRVCHM